MTRPTEVTVVLLLDTPILVSGVGAWSNTGRPRQYIAEEVVATATVSGVRVMFRGRIAANRRRLSSPFSSQDPAVGLHRERARRAARAAWSAAQ